MKASTALASALLALAGCGATPLTGPAESAAAKRLTVRSGGNVRPVIEALVSAFEKQTGTSVRYLAGASGKMLAEALEREDTDVYVAADLRHVRRAEGRGQVARKLPVARLQPAIIVRKGNPKGIRTLADLARPGLRVFVEGPEGCQLGDATARLLARHGLRIRPSEVRMEGRAPSLRTVLPFLESGNLDAAIVWDSTARRMAGSVDTVPIPADLALRVDIVGVVFRFASNREAAERFLGFLASGAGRRVWRELGFKTVDPGEGPSPPRRGGGPPSG